MNSIYSRRAYKAVAVFWLLAWLSPVPRVDARVVINEFMAQNSSTLQDGDGDYSDWIELFNAGSNTVNLLGWSLTDKPGNLKKWVFPSVSLSAGQYLLVFASEKDRRVAGQPLHTNFKLDGAGEFLALVGPDGVTLEDAYSPAYPNQDPDISYGLSPDSHVAMVSGSSTGKWTIPFPHIVNLWMQPVGFNDASWSAAAGGLGYEVSPSILAPWIQTPIPTATASIYTRYAFTLTGSESFDLLHLRVRFDDGFAAYLNGVAVVASNAPAVLNHQSLATATRDPGQAVLDTLYDLTPLRSALLDGQNVLAIQGLNVASNDGDFLLSATLTGLSTGNVVSVRFFTKPTPGTANTSGFSGKTQAPTFSLPAGFYTNSQTLVLAPGEDGAVIRYTLDGSEPTAASPAYAGPLTIQSRAGAPNVFSLIQTAPNGQWSWLPTWAPPVGEVFKGTVVRARAFSEGKVPSAIITRTYLVDTAIHERYGDLPVISLTSDRKHLFDNLTGIYVPGNTYSGSVTSGNYYQGWEKPMHMEWFEADGQLGFNLDLGVRIQGNTSVTSPHKGLSFYTRAEYGKTSVQYPLLAGSGSSAAEQQEFKRFMLRGWGSYRGRGLLYDPFSHILLDQWDLDIQDYRLCVVFINGEYWGLQELREAVKNSHYLEANYGVDRDDPGYDVLYGAGPYPSGKYAPGSVTDYSFIDEGDGTNWNETITYLNANNMALPEHYAYAKSRIDIENYVLYMVHSCFTVKYDWPNQNEAKYRPRTPDGRFRWLQFDLDHSFHDSWSTDMMPKLFGHNVFSRLQANTEFRQTVINCYADLMNTDFRSDVMLSRFDAMVASMKPYTNEFLRRWPITAGNSLDPHWANMRVNVANRTGYERVNVATAFGLAGTAELTLDVAPPGTGHVRLNGRLDVTERTRGVTNGVYPWKGIYYQGVPVTCAAIPADGYQFSRWQGLSTNTANPAVVTLAVPSALTAVFAPFAPSEFPLVISEIMYHPATGSGLLESNEAEFVELFNAGPGTLNLRDVTFTEGISFTFTNDFSLSPGGHVVLVSDLATFAARYDTNTVRIGGVFSGKLDNAGERLKLKRTPYGPTLAVMAYNDGREWPLTADGAGHSLVPLVLDDQLDGRLSHGSFWRGSARRHGSPGAVDPVPSADVVLNELMAHTDYDDPINAPGYDSNDWIELFNRGGSPVSFADWYLSDNADDLKKWAIPSGHSLSPGAWRSYDEVTGFHNPITNGFGLNKAGETVFLSYLPGSAADRVADAVAFKGQPQAVSLGRYPDGLGPWRELTPTRDTANGIPPRRVLISELMPHPAPSAEHPGNNANDEFIELWNPTDAPVTLDGEAGVWRLDGAITFDFPPGVTLEPNTYLVIVPFDPEGDSAARIAFQQTYGLTNYQVRMFGPFDGKLPNEGDRVALERPEPPDAVGEGAAWILVDEILYAPTAPWPDTTSGTGNGLRRIDADSFGMTPSAWVADRFPSPGRAPAKLTLAQPVTESLILLPYLGSVLALVDESQIVGAMTPVEFYLDGAFLAADPTAPYTAPLVNITEAGRHVVEARLTDAVGISTSAPVALEALTIDNASGATEVDESSARLHGRLTGNGSAIITLFWGPVDGGTNPAAWASAETLGTLGSGDFSRVVTGLTPGEQYYYRARAEVPTGPGWAPDSAAFRYSLGAWAHELRVTVRELTTTETLTNFPVLVALSTNIPGFRYGDFERPGGGDLRFAPNRDGAVYAHEIEHWDTNGTSHVWVRLPLLPPGETTFLALWGNPLAATPATSTNGAVWSEGYARVLHLNGGMTDSSPAGIAGSDGGSSPGAGVAGHGRLLDGVDDQLSPGPNAAWFGNTIHALTLSLWVQPDAKEGATAIGEFGGGRDLPLFITQSAGQWKFVVRNTTTINTEHPVRTGAWQQLALVLQNGQARAYLDGIPALASMAYEPFTPSHDLLVGHLNGQTAASYRMAGLVDEVRVANRAHSAAWLRASYLTVASNSVFTTYGEAPRFTDSDNDDLPDSWEEDYFERLDDPKGGPEDDWDGDGLNNRDEYVAGTDPTDDEDRFHLVVIPLGGSTWGITFMGLAAEPEHGIAERWYALEQRPALTGVNWGGIPTYTNIPGNDQAVTLATNLPSLGSGYFRGRVWTVPLP